MLVLGLAGGWVALWYYAVGRGEAAVEGWRAREAKAGREYICDRQAFGGFPFRFEMTCDGATAIFHGANPPFELKTPSIHVATQIYQPNLLIAEYVGPLSGGTRGQAPAMRLSWTLAQSSVRGTPSAPERVSIVVDQPVVERTNPAGTMLRAKHIEIHGRLADGSIASLPVIDIVLQAEQLSAPAAGPLATAPINADITGTLRGLTDFSPKSWPERFRDMQANGGRIEVSRARLQQGDTLALGSGTLSINARGRLDGQINMAVAGIEGFINALGAATQQRNGFGFTLGLGLLGGNARVEGRPAISLPLRVSDGSVFFGPLKVGEIPPLF
ncbi:DUF2125 domain-containing protein [Pseudolabrys sp.]|uniref:DUF2125 domain-containing protein n=1 Tax=Pseudolabrys sp. TaxID=1960880 RepID=UPI003D0DDCA9